ncbi:MAG: lysophospholipid acyltransferase family protein [Balneolaceae bacterium]
MQRLTSLLIWIGVSLLVLFWLPLIAVTRFFDRDPVRYRTGKMFRKLGLAISRINPNWKISLQGNKSANDRTPFIIVSNHLSNGDIPVISNLPWEMKWVAKKELFNLPIVGWMMRMAGDIPVDRRSRGKNIRTIKRCLFYLQRNCSVIFFPEGTRSRDGKVKDFSRIPFELAIRNNFPILPLVIDGTRECLPKNTWIFEPDVHARLKVLEPVDPNKYESADTDALVRDVRDQIIRQLMEWRDEPREQVDGLLHKNRNTNQSKPEN